MQVSEDVMERLVEELTSLLYYKINVKKAHRTITFAIALCAILNNLLGFMSFSKEYIIFNIV